jgi:hypothetical protein
MTTGQVVASTQGTQRLEYRYDGLLPASEKAVGEVAGRVTRTCAFRAIVIARSEAS